MIQVDIQTLINTGRSIQKDLRYVSPSPGVIRTFSVYIMPNEDVYYTWKECVIRCLQLYSKEDVTRFNQYADTFERHYDPRYILNMIGILEACKAIPSKQMESIQEANALDTEISTVVHMENLYLGLLNSDKEAANKRDTINAFHKWHAAASVLFDKWFYATDEDWMKFQDIEADGNGYTLKTEYDKIYTPYQKLMARLKDKRNIKKAKPNNVTTSFEKKDISKKINVFISYAHSDKKWLERLQKHLKVLSKYFESVDYWDDTKLKGGDRWKQEIESAISKANVAILLVSTSFLSSDFISTDELPPLLKKAEEDGTKILPLIVSPCAFTISELSDFQAINSPDRTLADLGSDEAAIERTYLELVKNIQEYI